MAVRKIIRLGHPTLRRTARPLNPKDIRSDELDRLVEDMIDTLRDYGGVGLAAPQVNESIRLAIVEISSWNKRYGRMNPMELTIFINPEITVIDSAADGMWEGCLSIPGLRGWVERPQHISVSYLDLDLNENEKEFVGLHATILQHELDHLDGILYIDRMTDMSNFSFIEEFEQFVLDFEEES